MEATMHIYNRQNTMVYREPELVFIKSYFKEIEVKMSDEQYRALLKLLSVAKQGISISHLLEMEDRSYLMPIIKLLHQTGSVFVYPNTVDIDSVSSKGWFHVLSQYMKPDQHLPRQIERIQSAKIFVDPMLLSVCPDLLSKFTEFSVNAKVYEGDPGTDLLGSEDWFVTLEPDVLNQQHHCIAIRIDDYQIHGTYYHPQDRELLHPSGGRRDFLNRKSLLARIAPIYTVLFTIKSIFGLSAKQFVLNDEGRFLEFDPNPGKTYEAIPLMQTDLARELPRTLDRISQFESLIYENKLPLKISGHQDAYADLYQPGITSYALKGEHDRSDFVYAGIDYEETAWKAIKLGLQRHFRKNDEPAWLVTDAENYYIDKVYYLLDYLEEQHDWFELKHECLKDTAASYYAERLSIPYRVFIKQYRLSLSMEVYLYIPEEDQYYSDGKLTVDYRRKLDELFLNYLLKRLNREKDYESVFSDSSYQAEPVISQDTELTEIEKSSFIERAQRIFKEHNIRYNEMAWTHELASSGLYIRKIIVGEYL